MYAAMRLINQQQVIKMIKTIIQIIRSTPFYLPIVSQCIPNGSGGFVIVKW
jgi:hypothetical protein